MQNQAVRRRPLNELLRAIDTCPSIDKLFELVKNEHIVIQMQSQQSASNLPQRPLPQRPEGTPLDRLRAQVREAAVRMYNEDHSFERLMYRIDTCPSIDKLFQLVKDEHIVIRMKSQSSASNLPQNRLTGAQLRPDSTPLERLRRQVIEAILYG